MDKAAFAKYFDHTLLNPMAVEADVRRHCQEALTWGFYAVCVQPRWVRVCVDMLRGTAVKVVSVAGFPFGTDLIDAQICQAKSVVAAGADEVDIVADLASVVSGDEHYLRRQFQSVLKVCRSYRPAVTLKVIIEAAALTSPQLQFVCRIANEVGVDFLKTSTGFHPAGGARADDVRAMAAAAPRCKIKAAGGIKTADAALAMIAAGASRIGASASVAILQQFLANANG